MPVHAIRESELADKSFTLPKIPQKQDLPSVQLSMAEIADESVPDLESQIAEVIAEPIEKNEESHSAPPLTVENISVAFAGFAETQKVSLISLIKLLIPKIEGKTIVVTMTKQQEEFIGDIKIEWQAFLKKFFKDSSINLQFNIDDQANTKIKAYTAGEQFEEMLKDNEMFKKMVNQFKLKLKT